MTSHPLEPTTRPLPRWGLWVLALLAIGLQCNTWQNMDGYQLADSVEYMERAQAVVHSETVIDSRQIRSFGYSAILTPIFFFTDLLGYHNAGGVVVLCRLLQMGIGLWLGWICFRLGDALGGAWTGFMAAFVLITNPVFLRFTVSPVAGISAAVCVGMGALMLFEPREKRRGFRAGLWLGLALLMAYKTIPITAVLVLLVILRERRHCFQILGPMAVSFVFAIVVQVTLDKVAYGVWGASLLAYLGENVFAILARIAIEIGQPQWADSLYLWYYSDVFTDPLPANRVVTDLQEPGWYWQNLTTFAVFPVAVMAGLGCARALCAGSWKSSLLLVTAVLNVYLFSQKGSKEFRLWLPLLPILASLAGWGFDGLLEACRRRRFKQTLLTLTAGSVLWLSLQAQIETGQFGGFWRAMAFVEEQIEGGYEPIPLLVDHYIDADEHARNRGRVRVGCSYHWSVFGREGIKTHLIKLPNQLDGWAHLPPEVQTSEVLPAIERLDWLILHQPILVAPGHALLTYFINDRFTIEAAFWDPAVEKSMGPILVLRRKRDRGFDPMRPTLFDMVNGPRTLPARSVFDVLFQFLTLRNPAGRRALTHWTAEAVRRRLGFNETIRLVRPGLQEDLWVLGSTYETLPGDGLGWLSLYLFTWSPLQANYDFVHELTTLDASPEAPSWTSAHLPVYGVSPTSDWAPGTLIRESWPVIASADHLEWEQLGAPVGSNQRRGQVMGLEHWFQAATFYFACPLCGTEVSGDPLASHDCDGIEWSGPGGEVLISGQLKRGDFTGPLPVRERPLDQLGAPEREWRWSESGKDRLGRFWAPVQRSKHFGRLLETLPQE